jgi:hypothetical protein
MRPARKDARSLQQFAAGRRQPDFYLGTPDAATRPWATVNRGTPMTPETDKSVWDEFYKSIPNADCLPPKLKPNLKPRSGCRRHV